MSTELAQLPVRDLEVMATKVAKSRLFNMDESQAFTLMLLCQSRGIHPIEAVMRYDIVQGRPAMKAEAMLAEFQRLGGSVEWLTENDNQDFQEAAFSHPTLCPKPKKIRYGVKDAARAGLAGKDNWKKNPAPMCRARVVSAALRMLAPGIVTGIYTPEEVRDFDGPPAEAVVIETKAKSLEPPASNAEALATMEADCHANSKEWARETVAKQSAKYQPPQAEAAPDGCIATPRGYEPVAPGEEPYQAYLFATVQQANDYWRTVHTTGGLPEPQPVLNLFQVENHLGSWAEEAGRIDSAYLKGENGARSRSKLRKFLAGWYRKYQPEFEGLVETYLSGKLEEAMAKAGLSTNDNGDDIDVPAELAAAVDGTAAAG